MSAADPVTVVTALAFSVTMVRASSVLRAAAATEGSVTVMV